MQNEELLRSGAELDTALELYSELYDFAPVGYFTLDRDSAIRQVNLTGARLLGVVRSEVVGRRLATFVADTDVRAFEALLARAIDSQVMQSCEVALQEQPSASESQPTHVQITVAASARADECRTIVVDVSDRRRAEAHVMAAQRLESIGRLAGGVAHDLNNILTIILSHVALALPVVGQGGSLHDDLLEVRSAANRAASLTRQLLAFGRKQVLRPEVVDANDIVRGLREMLRRLMDTNVELVLALAEDVGCVNVDAAQLEHVIVNLAINALEAMPRGGKLTVATSNVDISEAHAARYPMGRAGPFVLIAVKDTGRGMDAATLEHVFEPFFSTKQKAGGTGFGLSTVYGTVKQCGGDVSVNSKPGRGTTFEIYLPREAALAPRESGVRRTTEAAVGGTETILVVDDEEPLRKVINRMLSSVGYTVLVAGSGQEAIEMCRRHEGPVHLVLSDLVMANMNGVVLAEHLRGMRPEIRVLHMSGYADEAIGLYGAIDRALFIGKPFTSDALKQEVRAVLDSSRAVVAKQPSRVR
jgi:PAS domain S-box-containing protein